MAELEARVDVHLESDTTPELTVFDRIKSLAPNVGSVSLAKRLMQPRSYVSALRVLQDAPKWRRINTDFQEYTEANDGFFFVQIGANDGVGNDPIRRHALTHDWDGLLVEPLPDAFAKLKRTYAGRPGVSFANVAVSDTEGKATMLAGLELENGEGNPLSHMSSFHPEVVRKHAWLVDDFESLVQPLDVETTTLPKLLGEYSIRHIDGLFVDTEGHDKVVLDQLDQLDIALPPFVMYEHAHLQKDDQRELSGNLSDMGYDLTQLRRDMYAKLS